MSILNNFESIDINSLLAVKESDIKKQLICNICIQVIKGDPMQFCRGGHVFCQCCIVEWLQRDFSCPTCRQKFNGEAMIFFSDISDNKQIIHSINESLSLNNEIKRKRNKIKVHCPFYFKNEKLEEPDIENGCKEVMEYGNIKNHFIVCEYKFLKCSNSSQNYCKTFREKDYSKHNNECPYTKLNCNLCNTDHLRKDNHHEYCPKIKVQCVSCLSLFERKSLDLHYLECPQVIISCTFKKFGCNDQFKRIELSNHLQKYDNHFQFQDKNIEFLKSEVNFLKESFSKKIIKIESFRRVKNNVEIKPVPSLFVDYYSVFSCSIRIYNHIKYTHLDLIIKYGDKIIYNEKNIKIESDIVYPPERQISNIYNYFEEVEKIIVLHKKDSQNKYLEFLENQNYLKQIN